MELEDGLPPSVVSIIGYLARMAKGYNNHLKWNEEAKFKSDLMLNRVRWMNVDVAAFASKCAAEGMRQEDISQLAEWLRKAKDGRRLIPSRSYKGFKFNPPPEDPEPIHRSGSLL